MSRELASKLDLLSVRGRRGTGERLRRPGEHPPRSLQRTLETLARVSGELGHELNNQLAAALNYTYVLARRVEGDATLSEHVSEMRSAMWRAAELAGELRHFGRTGRTNSRCTDLLELVDELEPVLRHGMDPDRELDIRLDTALYPVSLARGPLESVLLRAVLLRHRSATPLPPLHIHAYNANHPTSDGTDRVLRFVQLEIGPLPARTPRRGDAEGASETAGQLISERIRRGLDEIGAQLDVVNDAEAITITLWLPAAE